MDLKAKIKVCKFLLSSLEGSIVSYMKSAESYDMSDDTELFGDYNTLGFILASVRDILKELESYESTDNVQG